LDRDATTNRLPSPTLTQQLGIISTTTMKLTTTTAFLAYAVSKAQAFSDSSPFILFSTAKYVNTNPLPASLSRAAGASN